MPCWYFDKEELLHSPSEAHGIDFATETRYREEGTGFIIELANKLGIQYDAYAAAVVYFHRFYVFQSFRNFHRHVTATSCLLLAAKMNSSSVTLQDLLKMIRMLLSDQQFSVFEVDPQQEVIKTEMSLLETLKFDLDVIHPYAYLLHFAKLLEGDKDTVQQLLHMSWTFINDSLYTTLCVQYEPDLLAVAFLYLACRLTKFEVNNWQGKPADYRGKWYEYFVNDMNINILKDICHQVLGLYSRGQGEVKVIQRTDSTRAHSPSPVRDRKKSLSPGGRRSRRRSTSRSRRRTSDSPSERTRPSERDSSTGRRRSSHSQSRSYGRRRSYSRSPDRQSRSNRKNRSGRRSPGERRSRSRKRSKSGRRSPSKHKSKSPVVPPVVPDASSLAPGLGACFLSRESFEELQAKLRAGQLASESLGMGIPSVGQFGPFPGPSLSVGPPGYSSIPFPPPPGQVVVALPLQPQLPVPGVTGAPFPPGIGFPSRLPPPTEFSQLSQLAAVHGPRVIGQPVVRVPPGNAEMQQFSHLLGPPPEIRAPFAPDFRGPFPPDTCRPPFPPASHVQFAPNVPPGPFLHNVRGQYFHDGHGPLPPDAHHPFPPSVPDSVPPDGRAIPKTDPVTPTGGKYYNKGAKATTRQNLVNVNVSVSNPFL